MDSTPSHQATVVVQSSTLAERRNEVLKARENEERALREKIAVIQERQEREMRLAQGRTHVQVFSSLSYYLIR